MDIGLVSHYFFPPDNRIRADVAIVFGMNDPVRPAQHAAELWHHGTVSRLLFTGGYNPKLGATEAGEMACLALAAGVPATAVLVEDKARNTDENARFSARLLAEMAGEDDPGPPDTVLLLTIHFHLLRACIAARRWLPRQTRLGWACYPSLHYTAADWWRVPRGREDALSEIDKISRYYGLSLDDIAAGRDG